MPYGPAATWDRENAYLCTDCAQAPHTQWLQARDPAQGTPPSVYENQCADPSFCERPRPQILLLPLRLNTDTQFLPCMSSEVTAFTFVILVAKLCGLQRALGCHSALIGPQLVARYTLAVSALQLRLAHISRPHDPLPPPFPARSRRAPYLPTHRLTIAGATSRCIA
eukprot:4169367-Pleurochrysis_carterae.AAC.1